MNHFAELQHRTGTSNHGLARLLGVRVDTIKNWRYGKCRVPDRVMTQLISYALQAEKIFAIP